MPGGLGRPPFEPKPDQRRMVKAMTAYGIPQLDICSVVGISLPTLHKYFHQEIAVAAAEANAKVAQTLFNVATQGTGKEAVTACIFWLKCRAGWCDTEGGIGKKGAAAEAAKAAGTGTDWGDDLLGPDARLN